MGVKGRTVTLKIMRRKANAPEPPKFMGHGSCDNFTRSKTLARYTDAPGDLAREGKDMLMAMRLDATQIRGIGLNVSCRRQATWCPQLTCVCHRDVIRQVSSQHWV